MQLELSQDEAHLLREVLTSYLKELRGEIVDTDNAEYKRNLRSEREQLEAIVERLDHVPQGEPATVTRFIRITNVWR